MTLRRPGNSTSGSGSAKLEVDVIEVGTMWAVAGVAFCAGIVSGIYAMRWIVLDEIRHLGTFEFGGRRIVGRVETKEWPK